MNPTPSIRLELFGQLSLVGASQDLLRRRKPLALLVYLAHGLRADAYHQRDVLCSLFWPDRPQANARASLRQALWIIESRAGRVLERRGQEEVRLLPGCVTSDVADFRAAVDSGEWQHAALLYRGPFLHGFHLDASIRYERWVDGMQVALAGEYRKALKALRPAAESAGAGSLPPRLWQDLSQRAPHEASAAEQLAQLLAAAPYHHAATSGAGSAGKVPEAPGSRPSPGKAARVPTWQPAGLAVAALAGGILLAGVLASGAPATATVAPTPPLLVAVEGFEPAPGTETSLSRAVGLIVGEAVQRVQGVDVVPYHALPPDGIAVPAVGGAAKARLSPWYGEAAIRAVIVATVDVRADAITIAVDVVDVESELSVGSTIHEMSRESPEAVARRIGERVATRIAGEYARPYAIRGDHAQTAAPPTLSAYLAFAEALAAFAEADWATAESRAREALALEPGFVGAMVEIATQRANQGDWAEARRLVAEIRQRGRTTSEWDRRRLEWLEAALDGDRNRRLQLIDRPGPGSTAYQRAYEYSNVGQLTRSQQILDEAERAGADPALRGMRTWLHTVNLHRLGRHEDERELVRKRRDDLRVGPRVRYEVRSVAAVGDVDAVADLHRDAQATEEPFLPARVAHEAGLELLAHGYPARGTEWLEMAVEEYGSAELPGPLALVRARALLALGRWDEARAAWLGLDQDVVSAVDRVGGLAVIDARVGNADSALKRVAALQRGDPADAGHRLVWQARIHAALGNHDLVAPLLESARAHGAAHPGWSHTFPEWRFLSDRGVLDSWLSVS